MTWSDGDGDVGGAVLDERERRADHAGRGGVRMTVAVPRRRSEVLAEQLVGAVDQVHTHGATYDAGTACGAAGTIHVADVSARDEVDELLSGEDGHHRAECQEGPERQRRPAARPVGRHHGDADDRAGEEAEEESGQHDAGVQPTEVHAEQGCEAHVTFAHAALADPVDQPHRDERDRRAEGHHPDAFGLVDHDRRDRERDAAEHDARVGDLAWQALRVQVDPGLCHEYRAEDAVRRQWRRVLEHEREQHEDSRGRELDDDRFDADRGSASPAPSPAGRPSSRRGSDRAGRGGGHTKCNGSVVPTPTRRAGHDPPPPSGTSRSPGRPRPRGRSAREDSSAQRPTRGPGRRRSESCRKRPDARVPPNGRGHRDERQRRDSIDRSDPLDATLIFGRFVDLCSRTIGQRRRTHARRGMCTRCAS